MIFAMNAPVVYYLREEGISAGVVGHAVWHLLHFHCDWWATCIRVASARPAVRYLKVWERSPGNCGVVNAISAQAA